MSIHPNQDSKPESDPESYYAGRAAPAQAPELEGDAHPRPLESNPPITAPKPSQSLPDEYPPEKTAVSPQEEPDRANDGQSQRQTPFPYFAPPPTYAESNPGSDYEKAPLLPPRPMGNNATAARHSSSTKVGFGDRLLSSVTGLAIRASGPVNRLTNRLGSETFMPSSLDKECDKAARILESFCTGFYSAPPPTPPPHPPSSVSPSPVNQSAQSQPNQHRVFIQIPRAAIAAAQGLAIFTTLRGGFHVSGATGSGLIVARLPGGAWSPPSAFSITGLGAGLVAGLDIRDCVCVLHTREAVEAFTRPRWSFGAGVGVTAGPVGGGVNVAAALAQRKKTTTTTKGAGNDISNENGSSGGGEADGKKHGHGHGHGHAIEPIWSYAKARGFYVGLQADGTVIVQRPDANAAFYGEHGISAERILRGQVPIAIGEKRERGDRDRDGNPMWPEGARRLVEALKKAEGGAADEAVIREIRSSTPTPGDLAMSNGVGVSWAEAGAVNVNTEKNHRISEDLYK